MKERLDSSSLRILDVVGWIIEWLAWGILFMFCALFAALLGAYVCTFLGLEKERFHHWGWFIGVAVGVVLFIRSCIRRGAKSHPSWRPTRTPDTAKPTKDAQRPLWVTRDGFREGFGGLFVGVLLGFALVFCWFSIANSPFAPVSWKQSLSQVTPSQNAKSHSDGDTYLGGQSTRHPLVFWLGLGPPVMLWLLSFFVGGFGGHMGRQPETQPATVNSQDRVEGNKYG